MNNYKQSGAAKGKELFITNYQIAWNLETNQISSMLEYPHHIHRLGNTKRENVS